MVHQERVLSKVKNPCPDLGNTSDKGAGSEAYDENKQRQYSHFCEMRDVQSLNEGRQEYFHRKMNQVQCE